VSQWLGGAAIVAGFTFGGGARAATAFAQGDSLHSEEPAAEGATKHLQKHRIGQRQERWSGSVGLILARCYHQEQSDSPCAPDLSTQDQDKTGGLALGVDAGVAYAASRRWTLAGEAIYEPNIGSIDPAASASYTVPLRKDLDQVHELSIASSLLSNSSIGAAATVAFSESLVYQPRGWLVSTELAASLGYGRETPASTRDVNVSATTLAVRALPLTERRLGLTGSADYDVTNHWSIGFGLGIDERWEVSAPTSYQVLATPLSISHRSGHWMDELSFNLIGDPPLDTMNTALELTVRWEF